MPLTFGDVEYLGMMPPARDDEDEPETNAESHEVDPNQLSLIPNESVTWVCAKCQTELDLTEPAIVHESLPYCIACYRDEFQSQCNECGEWFDNDDITHSDDTDENYCEQCYDDTHRECDNCGTSTHNDNLHIARGGYLICERCRDNYYTSCESCGNLIHMDHSYSDADDCNIYCQSCYDERERSDDDDDDDGLIHSHSYKPSPQFHRASTECNHIPCLGIELEIECSHRSDTAGTLDSMNDGSYYMKDDGSLNNGIEIVTHPCSLAYHQSSFPWSSMTAKLKREGCKSHNTTTCGLHIHIPKAHLTMSEQIKLGMLVNLQVARMDIFSRRHSNYAKTKRIVCGLDAKALPESDDRYEAVNYTNNKTIEIRIFKGTLHSPTILASIELTHAMMHWVKTVSISSLFSLDSSWESFLHYVQKSKSQYQNLITYLIAKNLNLSNILKPKAEKKGN